MENVPARAVAHPPAADWFAAAGTFLGRVWSAIRAFRGALHKPMPEARPAEGRATPGSGLERGELPESYGRTKVVALAVNPYLIHVYWELAGPQPAFDAACLRLHEAAGSSFDVAVDLSAKNWYVHLWSPDQRYSVELGVRRNGAFVSLALSNPVQTPRAWPVAEVSERFTRVDAPEQPEPPAAMPKVMEPPARPAEAARVEATRVSAAKAASAAAELTAGAIPAQPVATRPPAPRAADVLHERLTELYGLRRWERRPPSPLASGPAPSADQGAGPEPPGARPMDLTAAAETHFTPGVSSRKPLI